MSRVALKLLINSARSKHLLTCVHCCSSPSRSCLYGLPTCFADDSSSPASGIITIDCHHIFCANFVVKIFQFTFEIHCWGFRSLNRQTTLPLLNSEWIDYAGGWMCGSKLSVTAGKLIGEFGSRSVAEWACWFPSRSESHQSCWQYGILPHRVTALIRGQRAEQNECPRTQTQEKRENPKGTGFLLPVSCHIGHCALPWGVGRGGETRNSSCHRNKGEGEGWGVGGDPL